MNPDDYVSSSDPDPDAVRMLAQAVRIGTASLPTPDGVASFLALGFEGQGVHGERRSFVVHMPLDNVAEWMAGVAKVLADLDPNSFMVREVTEAEADGLRGN